MSTLPDGYETRTAPLRPETVVWLFRDGQRVRGSDGHPMWFIDQAEADAWLRALAVQKEAVRELMKRPPFAEHFDTGASRSRRSKRKERATDAERPAD